MRKKKIPLFRIFFLRHGETKYLGKFPDLTIAGVVTILRTAHVLRGRVGAKENVIIISSVTPRTRGSASIIAHLLGYKERVISSRSLGPMRINDQQRAKIIFQKYLQKGGMNALDLSYTQDPIYEDPSIFEPRNQVRSRLLTCLVRRMREFFDNESAENELKRPCFVAVSHFEVLYWFVQSLFRLDYDNGDKPLGYGELIGIAFWYRGNREKIWMDVTFRGKSLLGVPFNYSELL